jgi:hypothetical protein
MGAMKRRTSLLAGWILLVAVGCGDAQERAPAGAAPPDGAGGCLGYWESEKTSRGGIGSASYVKADGNVLSWMMVKVDGTYALDGDALTMGGALGGEKPHTVRIAIDGDRMVQTAEGGERQTMRRVGTGSGLHGTWQFKHYVGQTAFQRFRADGTTSLRLVMGTIVVRRYDALENGAIALRAGKKLTKATLRVREGVLVEDGGTTRLVRAGSMPWYPLP